ncbi:MAG: ATP-binding protein [Deltaproteobacteria bacterium]|nr:ATP-binding protein [Deltaproteobacteria bacterium]
MNMSFIRRVLDIASVVSQKSCFLFGPRQTGKTTLIQHDLNSDYFYNLLESDTFLTLSREPQRLRQEIKKRGAVVVIDEIQKLPLLLDEVHLLIEKQKCRFLLTGSSARKLRHGGVNLLGGRARHRVLHPFVFPEIPSLNLLQALNRGLIPSIYFSDAPEEDLNSYVGDYLKEEIVQEGLTRNIPAFSRFLEVAALCNGQLINYTEIGNDAQVPRTTVHEYFQILKDTLIAYELTPWKKSKKRKPLSTSKFYFFDPGVVRTLQKTPILDERSPSFGPAFEHYLFHELQAYCDYKQRGPLHYWRSTSGYEVDFILDDEIAIEIKAKKSVATRDLAGLRAIAEEHLLRKYLIVSLEPRPRKVDQIEILPWKTFLEDLWSG